VIANGLDAVTSGPAALLRLPAEPVTLALMLAVFLALTVWRKWPIGIALVLAAWAGAAVNGTYLPARHLIEGAFSYLDPILVIATAMIFMRVLADGGALSAAGTLVERMFSNRPAALLPLVMLIVMFPGMITGSSTASVLTTGAMAAPILIGLGLSPARAAALIAMGGVLGMVAPPINIPAMLIGGGIDLPYVGFDGPLALAAFPTALVVCYGLGWPLLRTRTRIIPRPMALTAVSATRPLLPFWRVVVPILTGAVLMVAPRAWPAWVPDPGLPLTFLVAAGVGILVLPRFPVSQSAERAMREVLPVLGILTGVGGFIQVMTLTGGRGWIVSVMLGAPPWAILAAAAVSMPLFGAVSAFGSASVLGVPFLLALLGRDEVVTTSGLSLLAGLGDLMLPAAVAATLAAQVAGVGDRRHVLKLCVVPALVSIAVAVLMLVFSPDIGRWMR
jgi:TRAP-type C4-dicarboxylate transport system permease large subunit